MRGDRELASVMRRMLEDETMVDLSWSHHDGCYIASISGTVNVSEEEAQMIEEAQNQ